MDADRRLLSDRRAAQRRSGFDRRGRISRRLADRKRETPAAYSPGDTAALRRLVLGGDRLVSCPLCRHPIQVKTGHPVGGVRVWEIHCLDCHRSALITHQNATRILVVDDDPLVRDALAIILSRAGHEVVEADGAREAIERYEEKSADIVLADLMMPEMDGNALIRRLLRIHPDARIVAMAGRARYGTPDPAMLARQLGAVHVIRKPFNPSDVLEVLMHVLGTPTSSEG